MKLFLFLTVIFFFSFNALSQTRLFKFDDLKKWERISRYGITNDGNIVFYEYGTEYYNCLVISKSNGYEKVRFPNSGGARFTSDSKYLIFHSQDNVVVLSLKNWSKRVIFNAHNFDIPNNIGGEWFTYFKKDTLVLESFNGSLVKKFSAVSQSLFSGDGRILVIKDSIFLSWVDLRTGKIKRICRGQNVDNVTYDSAGKQVVFNSIDSSGTTSIYYYKNGLDSAKLLVDNNKLNNKLFCLAQEGLEFSQDGTLVFFKLACKGANFARNVDKSVNIGVDIWSYRDEVLQSSQLLKNVNSSMRRYTAVISCTSGKIIQLEYDDRTMVNKSGNDFVLMKSLKNEAEAYWNCEQYPTFWIIRLSDGEQIHFLETSQFCDKIQMSTNGKYVTWYDRVAKSYYCYDPMRNFKTNVSPSTMFCNELSILGWLKSDVALLMRDRYDLWQIDPKGQKKLVDLTASDGRRQGIMLRPVESVETLKEIDLNEELVISGMKEDNMYNGFVKVKLSQENRIDQMELNRCIYFFPDVFSDDLPPAPIKAKKSKTYLLFHQSDVDAPNLITTENFSLFNKISYLRPQKEFNWFKAKLIKWYMPTGDLRRGILYIPDSVNKNTRAPLLVNYYGIHSSGCFLFKNPGLSSVNINVPWYLNRGYYVFIPDIYTCKGCVGENALQTVESGVKFILKDYSIIDEKRIGLQGQSFGGYITNYIVTHSDVFAAGQSSAGPTDMISGFGGIGFGGNSLQQNYEIGQMNLGTTPWDSVEIYIKNSPIFSVNNVKTPLLIMHNKKDDAVSFSQGLELFLALRRLRKPVWLLQYDDEGHLVPEYSNSAIDFSIRQQQFFDFFLKKMPPPYWMINSVPASVKGIESGLKLADSLSTRIQYHGVRNVDK